MSTSSELYENFGKNDLLDDQALLWASRDSGGVITAAVGHMLCELLDAEGTRSRLLRAASDEQLNQLSITHTIGLALWCVDDDSLLPPTCQSLCAMRECSPETICVAYVELTRRDLLPLLVEAGAQLIACDVPSLQSGLARAVRVAPRSNGGLHPLTTGLLERLPWGS
ncbi:MAG: hypothetical protein ABI557_04750 [Aureliella sp.]